MYDKVPTDLDFAGREKTIEKFWKDRRIFEKSMEENEGKPQYMFYDGPPTANGKPHIGHVLTRVIKDLIPRFWTMKGYEVPRKAGWDTHGLPVEIEVEKLLGLDGKEQIEEYGIAPFIEKCKESVWKYKGMWEKFSDQVGFWADMENPYVTYDNNYIESVWWSLKQIWDKGLLYKGYKIVPYCPRCGTPLSTHEVAQGYKDVKERSAIAKFKVSGENAYFLAWTTTPWTLPSNVALCVNPDEIYVKAKKGDDFYYLAEKLLEKVLGEDAVIIKRYKGSELERKEYHKLFAEIDYDVKEKLHYIVCDSYVTMEDGTGIVHIAPAFGEDDSRVGKKYGLPFVQFVDGKGEMTKETPWAGTFVKDADPLILDYLKEKGLLFSAPEFEHSYPFCWRCDTPLIYYARESWYIKMTEVRDSLVANNDTVNWIPESIGKGRFGDWLSNVQDWALSRNRYWGTPLPVWECGCGHRHAIGSIEELKEMSDNCPDDIELHRPYIDEVTIKCPECGEKMHRVPEVIDCWYDSGSMPFAQYHYPFENQEYFKSHFPADFISEAVDQTRGWFYSLMAISTIVFGKAPYKNVMVLGHVQDKDGQKMSKSKGNAVDPVEALDKYGADAIRWYFATNSAPWLPNRFHGDAVTEGQRKFMGTFWNTYAFFVLYANIDGFEAAGRRLEPEKLDNLMDKWILSRLNSMVAEVDRRLTAYQLPEAGKALDEFTDDLSNWYLRRSRERFWASGLEQDKINAYMTLYTCLVTLSKAAAPFIPFMTEEIYQNLVAERDSAAPESIHLCAFPESDAALIDKDLEENMKHVLSVVVMGRALRNSSGMKNRQPLERMYIKAPWEMGELYLSVAADELNIKNAEMTDDVRRYSSYSFKPQLKTLGPKFGKQINEIREALKGLDGNAAMDEINETGKLRLALSSGETEIDKDDLLIEAAQVEGYESASDNGITVVLDLNLTQELIEEGFIREVVSKIQTMRKEAGFEVMDMITIYISGNERLEDIISRKKDMMLKEVMATDVLTGKEGGISKEWDINGEKAVIGIEKN